MGHQDSRHKVLEAKQKQKSQRTVKVEPPPPKPPRRITKAKRKRLLARVEKADGILIRDGMIGLAVVFLVACAVIIPFAWLASQDTGWLGKVVGIGCSSVILGMLLIITLIVSQLRVSSVAREQKLVCQSCGEPLLSLQHHRINNPDYRVDYELPKRCPYCKKPIEHCA